jgi:hypothetical protein
MFVEYEPIFRLTYKVGNRWKFKRTWCVYDPDIRPLPFYAKTKRNAIKKYNKFKESK